MARVLGGDASVLFLRRKIQWKELGRISEDAGLIDDDAIEPGEELEDLNDPVQLAYALDSARRTMVYNAVGIRLSDRRNYLAIAHGHNGEELYVPKLYSREARQIKYFHPTPFSMAIVRYGVLGRLSRHNHA